MSKRQVLMIIGVLVAIFPFLGFPLGFQKFWAVVCGIVVAFIAYSLAPKVKPVKETDVPFSEHKSTGIPNQHKSAVLTNEKEATSTADTRSFVGTSSEEKSVAGANWQRPVKNADPQSSISTITNQKPPEQK